MTDPHRRSCNRIHTRSFCKFYYVWLKFGIIDTLYKLTSDVILLYSCIIIFYFFILSCLLAYFSSTTFFLKSKFEDQRATAHFSWQNYDMLDTTTVGCRIRQRQHTLYSILRREESEYDLSVFHVVGVGLIQSISRPFLQICRNAKNSAEIDDKSSDYTICNYWNDEKKDEHIQVIITK